MELIKIEKKPLNSKKSLCTLCRKCHHELPKLGSLLGCASGSLLACAKNKKLVIAGAAVGLAAVCAGVALAAHQNRR